MNNSFHFLNNNPLQNINTPYPTLPQFPAPPLQQGSDNSQRTIHVVPPGNPLGSLSIDSHSLLFGTPTQPVGFPSSTGTHSLRNTILALLKKLKSWFPLLNIPFIDAILLHTPPFDDGYECELGYFPFKFRSIRVSCKNENINNGLNLFIDEGVNIALRVLFRYLKDNVALKGHFIEVLDGLEFTLLYKDGVTFNSKPYKLATFDWRNESKHPEIFLHGNARSLIESFYSPFDTWDMDNGINEIIDSIFKHQNYTHKFACLYYEYDMGDGCWFPCNYSIAGKMDNQMLDKPQAIAFRFILDYLKNLDEKTLIHYSKRFKSITISIKLFDQINHFTLEQAIKYYQGPFFSYSNTGVPPLPLVINPVPSQRMTVVENRPSNLASSSNLDITFGGKTLRSLMLQLKVLCSSFNIPPAIESNLREAHVAFISHDGFERSIGYFPFKIESIKFKNTLGRPLQINPANEEARLVFHVLLRYFQWNRNYLTHFFKSDQFTFSVNFTTQIIEKAQAAGYDLNSLRMPVLDSFDWNNETIKPPGELKNPQFFRHLIGNFFNDREKKEDLAISLSKELLNDEDESLPYAFHYLQILHNRSLYPDGIKYNGRSRFYKYLNGPVLALFLKKLAFSPDYKKIMENVTSLNEWNVIFDSKGWSFSFEQLIQYMTKTGKDVFPMTPAIGKQILSFKGPLHTNIPEQQSTLPAPMSAQIPVVTRTTSAVTSVIPSTVTIAKTEVRSLDLLLEGNPDLKVEAEKMFRLLVDSVFLEKELIASNLVHAKGAWRFTLDSTFSGVLKNVLTTFLKGQPANKKLALSVIQHLLNYFPLRASTLLFPDLFDPDKDKIVDLLNQYGRMLAPPVSLFPFENDLRTQIIPILMRIKMLELKKIPLIQQMDIETKGSQIPCFLISAGIQQSQVSFLMAHFGNHGLLEGFSIDRENIGKNLLVGKGLMEVNLEEPINNQGALNAANLEKLKILFKNKSGKQRLPEFLVLEPPSLPNPVSQEPKVGSKRKKDAIDLVKEIEPKKKKVRILPLNETTKVKDIQLKSSSSSSDQMEIDEGDFKPVTDSLPDSTGEISWENLWHEMGRRVLEKLSSKSQDLSKQSLRSLSLSPLELPIVDLIHVARSRQMNFVPLNHLLKPYQAKAVKKLLISLEAGLSPLLALEMGTGKSWVINEMIAHLIGQGREGTILIVLPKSVVSQMAKENQNYLALVSATAWIAKKATLSPKDLTQFQKHIVEDIKIALVNEEIHQVMAYLPLLALFEGAQLYDSLYNSLPNHQNQFWNKLSNILESQLPLLLGTEGEQIVNEARAKASQLVLSKEKDVEVPWKNYFESEPLKNLLPGNCIEDVTFMPPLLFAQLRFAGTLILKVLSKVQAAMPKHYVNPLVRYLSRNTVQCNIKEEVTQALKEGKQVIITSYDAFQKTPQETFEGVKVAGLVFDEAQKLHTSDTTVSETCLAHIRHLKESHPKLPVILSTATPFENRLSELWTLLQLANPSEKILPNFTFERITKLIEEAQNFLHTMAKSETKEYPDKVIQAFVTSFAAAEAFRNALSFLVERKKRDDPSVIKDWGGVGPERKDEPPIKVKVTPVVEAKLSAALADFKKNRSHFIYSHKVNRILLHPDLAEGSLNNKNPETKKLLESLKSDHAIKEFLKGSPRLSTMLTEPNFVEMITQGEKGLILSEYVAEAEIARLAILSQYPGKVEVRLFSGGLSLEGRDRILEWYQAPSAGMSKVLILMKKAGGVGLNLPEAVKIFRTSDNWNPSVDAQAEDRANRVNKAGRRVFVSMNFDNYHDAHLRSVREVKKAIEAFFHQKNDVDTMTQFRQFCTLLLEQCYQSVLNEQKEVISASEKRKAMEAVLADLIDSITVEELALAVAACQPKLTYAPSLKLAQAGILPISYACSYDDAIRQAYLAEKKPDWTIGVLKRINNPLWREELRHGTFSQDNSQEKMAIWNELKSLESQPLTELSLSEIKATHTIVIYGGTPDAQGYQLQKIENPGLPSTLLLYRRQGKNGWHYDILNVLA